MQKDKPGEASMDEILASIRKIISEEPPGSVPGALPPKAEPSAHAPKLSIDPQPSRPQPRPAIADIDSDLADLIDGPKAGDSLPRAPVLDVPQMADPPRRSSWLFGRMSQSVPAPSPVLPPAAQPAPAAPQPAPSEARAPLIAPPADLVRPVPRAPDRLLFDPLPPPAAAPVSRPLPQEFNPPQAFTPVALPAAAAAVAEQLSKVVSPAEPAPVAPEPVPQPVAVAPVARKPDPEPAPIDGHAAAVAALINGADLADPPVEVETPAKASELDPALDAPVATAEPRPEGAAADVPPVSAAPRSLEDAVAEMLRPMLKQWLDDNMPAIVEKALRVELASRTPGA